MLFNSLSYIFLFIPLTVIIYFFLSKYKLVKVANGWLLCTSLFFYGYWNPKYIFLIIVSMLANYFTGTILFRRPISRYIRKVILVSTICFNLFLLGYFKYFNFFIENVDYFFRINIHIKQIVLPLAISFFTFQQIAFLVDSYKEKIKTCNFLNYCMFIAFFPQLIAGPIVLYNEMISQFESLRNKIPNYKNISIGLFLLSIGLFKKTVLADSLAQWANIGFDGLRSLNFFTAWITSLSYTFQLYFDFSGYTDMALGSAYFFNVKLPSNFNSPYKATNIQDFWRRWHIKLGRFFKRYLYIPLGGNRTGDLRTFFTLFFVFLIGGIWHGAGWTFAVWGALHGLCMIFHRIWQKLNIKIPQFIAWFLTFNFVNCTWIFFRAKSFEDVYKIISEMFNFNDIYFKDLLQFLSHNKGFLGEYELSFLFQKVPLGQNQIAMILIIMSFLILFFPQNSFQMIEDYKPSSLRTVFSCILCFCGLLTFLSEIPSKFIYFQF